jgi:hypothetical protein
MVQIMRMSGYKVDCMTDSTPAADARMRLLEVAHELMTLMKSITGPINKVVSSLQEEADMLLIQTANEIEHIPKTKRIKYGPTVDSGSEGAVDAHHASKDAPRTRSGRKCGLCGVVGHDARNCTSKKAQDKNARRGI